MFTFFSPSLEVTQERARIWRKGIQKNVIAQKNAVSRILLSEHISDKKEKAAYHTIWHSLARPIAPHVFQLSKDGSAAML